MMLGMGLWMLVFWGGIIALIVWASEVDRAAEGTRDAARRTPGRSSRSASPEARSPRRSSRGGGRSSLGRRGDAERRESTGAAGGRQVPAVSVVRELPGEDMTDWRASLRDGGRPVPQQGGPSALHGWRE